MKSRFKTVTLSSTKQNKEILTMARQCFEILSKKGVRVLADQNLPNLKEKGLKSYSEDFIVKESDLLISIGGDGTMLNCARKYGFHEIPILGINLGNLGFLNDIAPENLTDSLLSILDGEFVEDKRFFLETILKGKKQKFLALNEVVIHSGEIAQLIEFDLYIDKTFVYRQKADGLIVSSPTGSTAYSLSAGGPIVHPGVDSITISPMLPLSLNTTSLLVRGNNKIQVNLTNQSTKALISFDSYSNLTLKGGGEIIISKSTSNLKLIHPIGNDFFEACRNKLGWSSR